MLHLSALVVAASCVIGQTESPNYTALKPLEGILGHWTTKGEWQDGTPFVGEESSEWILNQNFMRSKGWFTAYDGKRVDYVLLTGWDAASQKIVEWFAFSDGAHSQRVGVYDPATKTWTCTEKGVTASGEHTSFDVTMRFVDSNKWTWHGTNFQGEQVPSELSFTFTRVTGATPSTYQPWLKYLAGKWTTTDQEGVSYDEIVELASGGTSLASRGKFADGVEYARQVGWQADTKSLVETWYLSSGTHLINRYAEIDARKLVGKTTIVDSTGQTAHGTITRERISDDEIKSVYRGAIPGQSEQVDMMWISKRK
jgi:hypothetical protein